MKKYLLISWISFVYFPMDKDWIGNFEAGDYSDFWRTVPASIYPPCRVHGGTNIRILSYHVLVIFYRFRITF